LLVPAATGVNGHQETYAADGDATRLKLEAEIAGLAVRAADVTAATYRELAAALPEGYAPDPATVRLELGAPPTLAPGRFQATARAEGRGRIDGAALAAILVGQPVSVARDYLNALPLAEPAALDVQPGWWARRVGRLPLHAGQIEVEILP
jgi:hypothetical protein